MLRRICRIILTGLAFVFAAHGARAVEVITHFDSAVSIDGNGVLDVTETIGVISEQVFIERGIFRDFPTERGKTRWGKFHNSFDVLSVTRDGAAEPWFTQSIDGGVRVYIGDRNHLLPKGEHTYVLKYRTDRQIGFFDDHDELYWNVTGNFWRFAILEASCTITLPDGAHAKNLAAYTGKVGGTAQAATIGEASDGRVAFKATQPLSQGEGLTVAVGWDKGFVRPPTLMQRALYAARDNISLVTVAGGFLLALAFYLLAWWHYGRDPAAGTIIAEYDPPRGLAPAACRYLLRMDWDEKAFTSAVMNMAARGYLKIAQLSKELYTLKKTGVSENQAGLSRGESKAAQELFGKTWTSIPLQQEHYQTFRAAIRELRSALGREHDYVHLIHNKGLVTVGLAVSGVALVAAAMLDPDMIGNVFLGLAFGAALTFVYFVVRRGMGFLRKAAVTAISTVMFFSSLLVAFAIHSLSRPDAGDAAQLDVTSGAVPLSLVTVALVVINIIFFDIMKAPTAAGRKLMDHIEGFRHYLMVAEKDRLNFHNPPDLTPERFETYLPYAVALDVENDWGKQFHSAMARVARERGETWDEDAYSPSWYSGQRGGWFGRDTSWSDMSSSFGNSVAAAAAAPSQSSGLSSGGGGGGFSGGGGGGGGGGGW